VVRERAEFYQLLERTKLVHNGGGFYKTGAKWKKELHAIEVFTTAGHLRVTISIDDHKINSYQHHVSEL
jgi:hypothetical protein